ncbi:MAG TPA: SUMF1/EgtB/PvdO family nonheme iron enzyme [Gammaproteobacteria bacterium]|nr:SUMF1/EgtB/PvdO family nonheme iron enzyme [Gammaproteobacteria bacterium]
MTAAANPLPVDLARERDFAVGGLRVRPAAREVEGATGTETLEPRVMQVLVALSQQQGEVLSRDELIARCWAGRVVSDDAVQRCIARLRRLAQAHGGFAVDTIPRVGYRLTTAERHVSPDVPPQPADSSGIPKRLRIAAAAAAVLALVAVAAWIGLDPYAPRADQDRTVAQVVELTQGDRYGEAFALGLPLVNAGGLERDTAFREAWRQIVLPMRPLVAEVGATVYFKGYADVDGPWIEAGVTPIEHPVPAPHGTLRIKVTKPGFRTAYFAVANPGPSVVSEPADVFIARNNIGEIPLPLIKDGSAPDDMVLVPRTNIPVFVSGWSTRQGSFRQDIPAFLIARSEVTNQQFKEFIDAGGYDKPAYWEGFEYTDGGRALSWEEARAKFVDATGRAGPAEWQLSSYPAGRDSYPVGGISRYEAAAYARFRGLTLPTIHHWARAAFGPYDPRFNVAPMVAVASRYSASGPAPADSEMGLGPWGTLHMSGNVREWASNFTEAGLGLALGGAWSDYTLENWGTSSTPPMDRSPTNGVRLMQADSDAALMSRLQEPIHRQNDGVLRPIAPVSDEVFAAMRLQFDQTRAKPLEASTSIVEETPQWIAEEVALRFADADAATLYVVKPRGHAAPLQPIIYAPPANCCVLKRPNRDSIEQLVEAGFVVDSGRALVILIWSGSYERFTPVDPDASLLPDRQRRSALAFGRDVGIAMDYLETRADIDVTHAGFLGISIGAVGQGIVLAIEPRLKAAVLISGGAIRVDEIHPMADLVNYAPRITVPVLMINGRMDHISPYETSQKPLLDLLGTDASAKAHIVYDGGHFDYRRNMVARNVSDWFDRYLGPAR